MLGLAVLFFLGLWILITLFAMRIGYKLFKKLWQKFYIGLLGAFLGFMLTMGGLIVYWTIEYIQIQRTVTRLCETEGGIKVYVTPGEWRKQIGEEELAKLYTFKSGQQSNYQKGTIKFKGRQYETFSQINDRIMVYAAFQQPRNYTLGGYYLYYDIKEKIPLFSINNFNSGVGAIANDLSGLKFWLNDIKDCDYKSTADEEDNLLNQYEKIGERKRRAG